MRPGAIQLALRRSLADGADDCGGRTSRADRCGDCCRWSHLWPWICRTLLRYRVVSIRCPTASAGSGRVHQGLAGHPSISAAGCWCPARSLRYRASRSEGVSARTSWPSPTRSPPRYFPVSRSLVRRRATSRQLGPSCSGTTNRLALRWTARTTGVDHAVEAVSHSHLPSRTVSGEGLRDRAAPRDVVPEESSVPVSSLRRECESVSGCVPSSDLQSFIHRSQMGHSCGGV